MLNARTATALLASSITLSALAGTLQVPGDYATIQAAINAARDGDTIVVADGTYTGPGNRDISFRNKALTVRSANGPDACIIDCEGSGSQPHRAFLLPTGDKDAALEGFTIQNGFQDLNSGWGGAVLRSASSSSTSTIQNCVFQNNKAGKGGAIFFWGGDLNMTNCVFRDNLATIASGAIHAESDPDKSVVLLYCTFFRNRTTSPDQNGGGAVQAFHSEFTVSECAFVENSTARIGGGLWLLKGARATVMNCGFLGNSAAKGAGALAVSNDSIGSIANCVFTGNTMIAQNDGVPAAALWVGDGQGPPASASIVDCTFSQNSAPKGLAALVINKTSNAAVTNCIFRENTPAAIGLTGSATIDVSYSDVQGGWSGTGNIDADPHFLRKPSPGDDGEWGTDDDDYGDLRLSAGSPCIDAADNDAVPPDTDDFDGDGDRDEPMPFDLDGLPRFVDDPDTADTGNGTAPIVDMGAYEYQGPPIHRGDLNCDDSVDFNDIDPFVTALISRDDYEAQYPDCNYLNGDINQDGSVDFNDIDGFVDCLIKGGCE